MILLTFADSEISSEDYSRIKLRYENNIRELKTERKNIGVLSKDVLTQLKHISLTISDLGKFYSNADAAIKREIIGSIFPGNLIYFRKRVRTNRVNEVIKLFCPSFKRYEIKEKGQKPENLSLSSRVNSEGLEPPTFWSVARCSIH